MARKDKEQTAPESRTAAGLGFGGLLDGIQKLVEAAAKMKDSGQISQSGEFTVPGLGEKGKGIFGFSIKTMAGGDSPSVTVRPFGNIHKTKEGMAVEEAREPVVDVLDEGARLRVIAELPGVSEADISYQVAGDVLTISTKGERGYHAEVLLPCPVQSEGMESAYNNGVLELKLRKVVGSGGSSS